MTIRRVRNDRRSSHRHRVHGRGTGGAPLHIHFKDGRAYPVQRTSVPGMAYKPRGTVDGPHPGRLLIRLRSIFWTLTIDSVRAAAIAGVM